jgi:hypothetical protein|tara:strand:- start:3702 stop:3962 length:261 start_codon:yes stop_codon:yes gene_type:complete
MSAKETIKNTLDLVKMQRDELNVRIHLANMEVRDEWEDLERKWEEFTAKCHHLQQEVDPVVEDIHSATSLLGSELAAGYRKIKKAL